MPTSNIASKNDSIIACNFVNNKINAALSNKSLIGTGLEFLEIYDISTNNKVDWQNVSFTGSYYGLTNLDSISKSVFDSILQRLPKDPNLPTECCVNNFIGYNQPNINENLFLLWTGRGLQNYYGVHNSYYFSIAGSCPGSTNFHAWSHYLPNDPGQIFPCVGYDNWFAFANFKPGALGNLCCNITVSRSNGYYTLNPSNGNPFYNKVCESVNYITWGTCQ